MPNESWYETSEDMQMPLPLREEEANRITDGLTEERKPVGGRYPSITLPNHMEITVIPIIPEITSLGYVRFLNASPSQQNADIYVNGRKVVSELLYREFTDYMKVFPGWYRIALYAAGTKENPLSVSTLRVQGNDVFTEAVIGLAEDISLLTIHDSCRRLNEEHAYIRFVQLSPNAPTMDAYWDDALVLAELDYKDVSRYLKASEGNHNLKMRDTLSGANLAENPDITVKNGEAYTVYIVGDMNDRTGLQILVSKEDTSHL